MELEGVIPVRAVFYIGCDDPLLHLAREVREARDIAVLDPHGGHQLPPVQKVPIHIGEPGVALDC